MTDRSVPITLDRVRHLRFSPNDVSDIEELMGVPLPSFFSDSSIRMMRAMLWGGLKWEDPTLTLTGAGDLMQVHLNNGGTLAQLFDKCAEALVVAGWFKPKGAGNVEREPLKNSDGRG